MNALLQQRYGVVAGILASCMAPALCPGAEDGEPPIVSVRVVIDASSLKNGLDHLRNSVELRAAESVVELCRDKFGFIDWQPFAAEGVGDVACLTLRITDDPSATSLPAIHAQYYVGSSNATWQPLNHVNSLLRRLMAPATTPPTLLAVVYGEYELPPSHDDDRVADRIRAVVRRQFDTPEFCDHVHERFLRGIPLAQTIHVHVTDERVVIPLQIDRLKASNSSRFLVVVNSEVQQNTPQDGEIELEKSGAAGTTPSDTRRLVQCIVTRLVFPMYDRQAFDPVIETIANKAKSIQVFMLKYVPDVVPATSGRLVTGV